jgi:hypothetical protein
MLVGDADQGAGHPAQCGLIGQASIDPGPAFSAGLDGPFDQELILGRKAQGFKKFLEKTIGWKGKKGFNPGFLRTLTDGVWSRFFAQQEIDGLDNDRFPRKEYSIPWRKIGPSGQ